VTFYLSTIPYDVTFNLNRLIKLYYAYQVIFFCIRLDGVFYDAVSIGRRAPLMLITSV